MTIKILAALGSVQLWLAVPPAPDAKALELGHRAELLWKGWRAFLQQVPEWSLQKDTIPTPITSHSQRPVPTPPCLQQQRCHIRHMAAWGGCPVPIRGRGAHLKCCWCLSFWPPGNSSQAPFTKGCPDCASVNVWQIPLHLQLKGTHATVGHHWKVHTLLKPVSD